ncbi:WXG100 family type VII secretion target [Nocardia tenerifensis]|uniref:WXG100 family type VII secretion target n=1 Tax=Nocardia tenerifensis TaxID=228006 RepID=A0A318JNQ1_9NOCA|nr:WXG100 family type VII secretion target [Nocardia tenerifensis]PXX55601.1 WXG100 family type VII secretion target [Nocardia tenerifensis]
MGDPLEVHQSKLRATATWLEQSAHEFADDVDSHMRKVHEFVGGEWRGDAAKSHQSPWDDWEEGARRIIGSFITDAGLLRDAAATYVRTDGGSADSIGRGGRA